jgi:ATP-dependent DNA helicase RecQ
MALATEEPLADLLNSTLKKRLSASLHEVFGVDSLRPGQEAVIRNVLRRVHTLAIMPTGAGKSLCYQLPALYLGGLTLVVSPLISLMKDQLENLLEAGVPAALLNSSLSASEEKQALDAVSQGECQILFVTPERLVKEDFIAMLDAAEKAKVALVVVDEAHCVSQWGHDFRPAFIEMLDSIKALGRPPILALTATATSAVMTDILNQLGMCNASVVNTGVYRANLRFAVEQFTNPQAPPTITPGPRERRAAHDAQNAQSAARQARIWQVGDEVRVRRYGAGVVELASGERVAVTFPDGRTRTFISRYLRPKTSDDREQCVGQ